MNIQDFIDPTTTSHPMAWPLTILAGMVVATGALLGSLTNVIQPVSMDTLTNVQVLIEYINFLHQVIYALAAAILGMAGTMGAGVSWFAIKMMREIRANTKASNGLTKSVEKLDDIMQVQMDHWNLAGVKAINAGTDHITSQFEGKPFQPSARPPKTKPQ